MLVKTFPAALLYLNGLLYLGVAWLFVSDADAWFADLGISTRSAVGMTELRAVYVGLMAAFGLFLLLCGWKREWRLQGVLLMVLSYAGLVIARSWGILVEEDYNDLIFQIYIAEWLALVLSLLAVLSLRRPSA
jgi:hypothetical protein